RLVAGSAERSGGPSGGGHENEGSGARAEGHPEERAGEGVPGPAEAEETDAVPPVPPGGLPDRQRGDRRSVPALREGPHGADGDELDARGSAGAAGVAEHGAER